MARFNNRNRLRPINSIKHIVDKQQAFALGVQTTNDLIKAVDTPDNANTSEVITGSTVNSVYLKVEVVNTGTTGVFANAYFIIFKNPGANLTIPSPALVGPTDTKKHVIHQEMVMLQFVDNSNPRTMFQGVINIPRGYRRFGTDDKLQISYIAPGVELSTCHQCIFKEYR